MPASTLRRAAASLRYTGLAIPILVAWCAGTRPASAQVFRVEAGTSSLYQAHGGSLGFHTPNSEGWVGVGSMDGLRFGAFMRTKVHDSILTFGDDTIPFRLGTDVFDRSHYFLGRGVGLTQQRGATRIFGFVGATSWGLGTPYFRASETSNGVGLLFLDRQLTPTLSAFFRTVISNRQTTINGLEWQPRSGLRAAVAGGVGANQGYGATSFTVDRELYTLKAAYIRAGDQFRRVAVEQPLSSEIDRIKRDVHSSTHCDSRLDGRPAELPATDIARKPRRPWLGKPIRSDFLRCSIQCEQRVL